MRPVTQPAIRTGASSRSVLKAIDAVPRGFRKSIAPTSRLNTNARSRYTETDVYHGACNVHFRIRASFIVLRNSIFLHVMLALHNDVAFDKAGIIFIFIIN